MKISEMYAELSALNREYESLSRIERSKWHGFELTGKIWRLKDKIRRLEYALSLVDFEFPVL